MAKLVLLTVLGYAIGSLTFGYWVGRLRGVDLRRHGSGNIGATNAFRLLGPGPALAVLALDAGKGALAAGLGYAFGAPAPQWAAALAGLAAVGGHNWPWSLRFRGGRGAATGVGVMLALVPQLSLPAIGVFIVTVAATRWVSLGSILAATLAAGLGLGLDLPLPYRLVAVVGSGFILVRHLPNIRRLLAGTEPRLRLGGPTGRAAGPGRAGAP